MDATQTEQLKTTGDIAREDGVTKNAIDYAIIQYHISEVQKAYIIGLFNAEGVRRIRSALRRIAERRGGP